MNFLYLRRGFRKLSSDR